MNDAGMQLFELLVALAGIQQMSEFIVYLHELDQNIKNVLSIIGGFTIVVGILQCFFGFKLFKLWCGFIGFMIGLTAGLIFYATGIISGSIILDIIAVIIIIFLCCIGAYIAYRAYLVGVFLYTFAAAFIIGFIVMGLITDSVTTGVVAGLIAGVTMGVIAVIFQRFWIIAATSISGGIAIGTSLMMILQNTESVWNFILPPVFIVAGFIIQHNTVKKSPRHGKPGIVMAHPSQPPPVYINVAVQDQNQKEVTEQVSSQPAPSEAVTEPLPVAGACPSCGHTPFDATAPCAGCAGTAHMSKQPEFYTD